MNILGLFFIGIILMGLGFLALALLVFKAYKRLRAVVDSIKNNSQEAEYFDYSNLFLPHHEGKKNLLIYGYDLKFLQIFYFYFSKDFNVVIIQDKYLHKIVNPGLIQEKLAWADIIWVEWLTEQAVFVSNHVKKHQKLFIRMHACERFRKHGFDVNTSNVSKIIVINPHMGDEICEIFGYNKKVIEFIPNGIETSIYDKPKEGDYLHSIALIGYHRRLKRLDLALDLLERLLLKDKNYKLYLVGQHPTKWFEWRTEKEYFEPLLEKIENSLKDSVVFIPFTDLSSFLANIGFVLSTSDHEGSHQSPTEGLASASLAFCLPWAGVRNMYLSDFVVQNIDEMANKIDYYTNNLDDYSLLAKKGQIFVQDNYDVANVYQKIKTLMLGET